MRISSLFFLAILLCSSIILMGQTKYTSKWSLPTLDQISAEDSIEDENCEIRDIRDLLRKKNKPVPTPKKVSLLILPSVSANPANGLLLGLGGNIAWYFGSSKNTRITLVNFSVAVTTKEQFISFVKSTLYTNDNKFYLDGDWRFYKYRAPTYGLGTNAPDTTFERNFAWMGADMDESTGGYPMLYDYLIIHEIVNRKIKKNMYIGIGYHLDKYWNISDENLNLDTVPKQLTPHWSYSKVYEFDSSEYMESGLSLNLMYDSRDNQISPYTGYYVKLNYRYNATFLGSDKNSSRLWVEFRTYVGLSGKIPRHLIAFWFFGNFLISGTEPYFGLMSLGNDQRGRSGRGYIAGRYRGEDMLYAEAEYRFPILLCSQTLGGVLFVNAMTATNRGKDVGLFDYIKPAAGVGLRVLVNKNIRLSINIDFAVGYKSSGLYFAGSETF